MFKLTVVTPEKRLVLNQEIDEVTVPGELGELNILPGHAPLITTLETGILSWKLKGSTHAEKAVVSWGYCQVTPQGVDILADIADLPNEVDVEEASKLLAEAERKASHGEMDEAQWAGARREIARLRADLEIAKR